MANFTTETDVREKLQLTDFIQAPDALLTRSIADAHVQIVRRLDLAKKSEPPDPDLVLGETLLAGAHVLRSLAIGTAFKMRHITIGGNRIAPSQRDARLHGLADAIESQAWDVLEPFLLWPSRRVILRLTFPRPVFEE